MFAVYFATESKPGEHWRENAQSDDSDRKQHWKKGDLYSLSSTRPESVPPQFGIKEVREQQPNERWNPHALDWEQAQAPTFGDPVAQELADAGLVDAARYLDEKRATERRAQKAKPAH